MLNVCIPYQGDSFWSELLVNEVIGCYLSKDHVANGSTLKLYPSNVFIEIPAVIQSVTIIAPIPNRK